jgi:hypothetical protein
MVEQLSTEFDELRKDILDLKARLDGQQTDSNCQTPDPIDGLGRQPVWSPSIDSRIISEFPEIFTEFRGKYFGILWRGSRDGFSAKEFHRRCDGHGNTLILIFDTTGNIFGGFTPMEWESGGWHSKGDDSLRSFLFTLKNPHNFPARKFPLRAEENLRAIICDFEWGPDFWNIRVSDHCNENSKSDSYLGSSYTNDTGLDGKTFFTGSRQFQVKEIEVFEVVEGGQFASTGPNQLLFQAGKESDLRGLIDSRIISEFPEIFTEFRGKYFGILWRGSRDGFSAKEFHRRCDGHGNTLILIFDTTGNIFGGFTPVEWESNSGEKADDSQNSFVFTLKNPHNIPARRFALKAEKKHQAIVCNSKWSPRFCDIGVYNNCNANTGSYTHLGIGYTNDSGLDWSIVFTGSTNFKVKEIEVFEITE